MIRSINVAVILCEIPANCWRYLACRLHILLYFTETFFFLQLALMSTSQREVTKDYLLPMYPEDDGFHPGQHFLFSSAFKHTYMKKGMEEKHILEDKKAYLFKFLFESLLYST